MATTLQANIWSSEIFLVSITGHPDQEGLGRKKAKGRGGIDGGKIEDMVVIGNVATYGSICQDCLSTSSCTRGSSMRGLGCHDRFDFAASEAWAIGEDSPAVDEYESKPRRSRL